MKKTPAPVKKTARHDKYFLRDLHQEIDLYDRKLADLKAYVEFASPQDREDAANKLLSKRASLEKTALELAAAGVEYEQKDLPRSFSSTNHEPSGQAKTLVLVKES